MASDTMVEKVSNTATLGVPGYTVYGGYITTPETNKDLVGSKKYTKFSEVLVNTAIVGAGVRYFLNLASKASWKVVPADKSPEAEKLAKFVETAMGDMETPWTRIVRRAAMYRFYGFSVQEWTAKRKKNGQILMADIAIRPQSTIDRWELGEHGEVKGVWQMSPQSFKEIFLPRGKIIYVVDDSLSDNPEGIGLFRHIYPHAQRLGVYEKLEGLGFETDLRGIPIARAPLALLKQMVTEGKITKEQEAAWIKTLTDFVSNHIRNLETGLMLDSMPYRTTDEKGQPSTQKMWDLELLKGEPTSLTDLANAINRVTRQIAILLGVEQLLLGNDSTGSFALSRDKTNAFFLIIDSTLTELAESFGKDFIGALWRLNGFDPELKPWFMPEAIKFKDVEQVSKTLQDMASAGAKLTNDDPAVNEVRDLLGLSHVPIKTTAPDPEATPTDDVPDPKDDPEEVDDDGATS